MREASVRVCAWSVRAGWFELADVNLDTIGAEEYAGSYWNDLTPTMARTTAVSPSYSYYYHDGSDAEFFSDF